MDKLVKVHHNNLGQSIVEVIVAVAVIVLVLGGVVALMVKTMGSKTETFDRIKATEFAQVLMEEKVNESKNQQETFWSKVDGVGETKPGVDFGYPEFTGSITTQNVTTPAACDVAPELPKCAKVIVSIIWQEKVEKTISFERFFAKN